MLRISYWVFPILAGLVWLGMLLGMLLHCKILATRIHGQNAMVNDFAAVLI